MSTRNSAAGGDWGNPLPPSRSETPPRHPARCGSPARPGPRGCLRCLRRQHSVAVPRRACLRRCHGPVQSALRPRPRSGSRSRASRARPASLGSRNACRPRTCRPRGRAPGRRPSDPLECGGDPLARDRGNPPPPSRSDPPPREATLPAPERRCLRPAAMPPPRQSGGDPLARDWGNPPPPARSDAPPQGARRRPVGSGQPVDSAVAWKTRALRSAATEPSSRARLPHHLDGADAAHRTHRHRRPCSRTRDHENDFDDPLRH